MSADLRARLAAVPSSHPELAPAVRARAADTVAALESPDALASLAVDPYWPKWDSPWWEMIALAEVGLADLIPKRVVLALVEALNAMPMHTFPIRPEEWPEGIDRHRHTSCHCALGNIDQVLAACGVDVDRELPWIREWYARYQMADGGYNCDETAYLAEGETPSSMVGTIAVFEALIARGPSEECDRAAAFMIERELRHGSQTQHNAAERESAKAWGELTFPRFYFYDVLRGATALVRWAVQHGRTLPLAAISPVLEHLLAIGADGTLRVGRRAWDGKKTRTPVNNWEARQPAKTTALIEGTSVVGDANAILTQQWTELRANVIALIDAGRAL